MRSSILVILLATLLASLAWGQTDTPPLHEKALTIAEAALARGNSTTAWILHSLTSALRRHNESEEALAYADRACRMWLRMFKENAVVLSERDVLAYSHSCRYSINNYLSCCRDVGFENLPNVNPAIDVILASKGQIADEMYMNRNELLFELLREIQLKKLEEMRTAGRSDHPVSWGAFIAAGDWR